MSAKFFEAFSYYSFNSYLFCLISFLILVIYVFANFLLCQSCGRALSILLGFFPPQRPSFWFHWFSLLFSCFQLHWIIFISLLFSSFFLLWVYFVIPFLIFWGRNWDYWFEPLTASHIFWYVYFYFFFSSTHF